MSVATPAADRIQWFSEHFEAIVSNIEQVIQGKREVIELITMCLIAQGHVHKSLLSLLEAPTALPSSARYESSCTHQ